MAILTHTQYQILDLFIRSHNADYMLPYHLAFVERHRQYSIDLENKGFIEKTGTTYGSDNGPYYPYYRITPSGRVAHDCYKESSLKVLVNGLVFPVVVSIITTLLTMAIKSNF